MMQKWEYEFVSLDKFDATTPELGAERMTRLCGQKGWELVQIIDGIAYFKRPIDWSMKEDADWEKYKEFAREIILKNFDKMGQEEFDRDFPETKKLYDLEKDEGS